jgi:hypothetical protein
MRNLFLFILLFGSLNTSWSQNNQETSNSKYLYKPKGINADSICVTDTTSLHIQFIIDSLNLIRVQHIQDSIVAREEFIRDSIAHRQHILDSLNMIKSQLPTLLDASIKTFSENIFITFSKINIIGDSMLGDFTCSVLPLNIDQPYTPWKSTINLSDKPPKIALDPKTGKIVSIASPGLNCTFGYSSRPGILRLTGKGMIATINSGKVFKLPVDSVFFNGQGQVIKIKRYFLIHQVVNNYQQGPFLYGWLSQVKQYDYINGQLVKYQLVNFCENKGQPQGDKVCYMVIYTISHQGNNYIVTRRNDPPNSYSDGTFTYEFDNVQILKSVAFNNFSSTEDWKTFIELNEAGYVSNYIYQNKGFVNKSLLINYYLNDPKAKNKIETISCTFEDDGVSYYQINNTTGKSRVRDHLTMEWSDWK